MRNNLVILPAILLGWLATINGHSQAYTSYFTGDPSDVQTQPTGGVCLMGGATEHDEAMKWFLQRADGGDVLVIRASGSDGYNDYLYSQLGVAVNSVETIVWHSAAASSDAYVMQQVQNAEAIWIAGGDQWNYVSYWKNTAIDAAINDRVANDNIVMGGTSAGMAVMGQAYFSAMNGTVTSTQALSNPYHSNVTLGYNDFLHVPYLENVVTDSHYDNPDRKGRHVSFLARLMTDEAIMPFGIACDEYTAVCIDANGTASVYGEWPSYDDFAYFIQPNCWPPNEPEVCQVGSPLSWDRNMMALKVYVINGEASGSRTFDMIDKESGVGGTWQDWYIINGILTIVGNTSPINCNTGVVGEEQIGELLQFDSRTWMLQGPPQELQIMSTNGQLIKTIACNGSCILELNHIPKGFYLVRSNRNWTKHISVY